MTVPAFRSFEDGRVSTLPTPYEVISTMNHHGVGDFSETGTGRDKLPLITLVPRRCSSSQCPVSRIEKSNFESSEQSSLFQNPDQVALRY